MVSLSMMVVVDVVDVDFVGDAGGGVGSVVGVVVGVDGGNDGDCRCCRQTSRGADRQLAGPCRAPHAHACITGEEFVRQLKGGGGGGGREEL